MFAGAALARVVVVACVLVAFSGGVSLASTAPDLPQSYIFTPPGKFARLQATTMYGASQFPIQLRVTPPDGTWWAAQWKSGSDYFAGGAPPNFGWVHLAKTTGPMTVPRGMVSIIAAYGRTPSVGATAEVLRTRGHGASYETTVPTKLAGYAGVQFDGHITGTKNVDHIGHFFIPFSPPSHAAKYYADEYGVYGDVFRVIVLDVRGHTVVIYIENGALPPSQFPAFLDQAERILTTLHFPT
jgi:hypothetical protein